MERDSSLIEEGTGGLLSLLAGIWPPFIPIRFPINSWSNHHQAIRP
jgi:hypothetical protein